MAIPRDRVCYFCSRGEHSKCVVPKSCACWTCYPTLFTERGYAVLQINVQEDPACTLCSGICSWACFAKRPEGDDARSEAASHFTP